MRRRECVLVAVPVYGKEAVAAKKAYDILLAKYLP